MPSAKTHDWEVGCHRACHVILSQFPVSFSMEHKTLFFYKLLRSSCHTMTIDHVDQNYVDHYCQVTINDIMKINECNKKKLPYCKSTPYDLSTIFSSYSVYSLYSFQKLYYVQNCLWLYHRQYGQ